MPMTKIKFHKKIITITCSIVSSWFLVWNDISQIAIKLFSNCKAISNLPAFPSYITMGKLIYDHQFDLISYIASKCLQCMLLVEIEIDCLFLGWIKNYAWNIVKIIWIWILFNLNIKIFYSSNCKLKHGFLDKPANLLKILFVPVPLPRVWKFTE